MFIHAKVNFEKKPGASNWEISVSFTTQEYDNVTTPYYLISALSTYERLKPKENLKLLGLKEVAVAYER